MTEAEAGPDEGPLDGDQGAISDQGIQERAGCGTLAQGVGRGRDARIPLGPGAVIAPAAAGRPIGSADRRAR